MLLRSSVDVLLLLKLVFLMLVLSFLPALLHVVVTAFRYPFIGSILAPNKLPLGALATLALPTSRTSALRGLNRKGKSTLLLLGHRSESLRGHMDQTLMLVRLSLFA